MNKKQIEREAEQEFKKNSSELVKDIIREANELPKEPASEKENLDIIKHLIKRLTVHQIILEEKANKIGLWLIILSIIMAVGALFSIFQFFFK